MKNGQAFGSGEFTEWDNPAPNTGSQRTAETHESISTPSRFLVDEAKGLLTRLAMIKPFALQIPMVMAAGISPAAQTAIERYLQQGRAHLRQLIRRFLYWLDMLEGRSASPAEAQRRFALLKTQFNNVISDFDLFSDVLVQRCEHETGTWLSGLDAFAADALHLPGNYYKAPPVICYLDRGPGASIRRARTRLFTQGRNPVAIIRVPRERMVGSGIASSIAHEVGHQAAELLGLIPSIRPLLQGFRRNGGAEAQAWELWDRWISEIVADFWSVAKVGVASTMGLMGVLSLPRPFVFRVSIDDPHPIPWIRVKLSCSLGQAMFPHPQWAQLAKIWESYYPHDGLDDDRRRLLVLLESTLPGLVTLLVRHRPARLKGRSMMEALSTAQIQPSRLMAHAEAWRLGRLRINTVSPSLGFAVIGQMKMTDTINSEQEGRIISGLLRGWALNSAVEKKGDDALTALRPSTIHTKGH